ncbi:hypothetical protein CBP52_14520 [Cellulomonas sp. PSBB021]|nr:hypothetical protein CBP52_14520 [Cellulomonas sp. PSBB021]
MSTRVSRARAVIATGRQPAVVARVARVSRQALYRPILRRPPGAGPGRGRPGDDAIVEVARANPVDGTRMVAALASRALGEPVNRKRVQRVMRAHGLLQRSRNTDRRRRPGYFRVRRPDELWHLDMTKVSTAAHGWVYLHVAVDCCTREVAGWTLDVRTRTDEAIACVEGAVLARSVTPGRLTLGTDNGSQFTSRGFRKHLSARGITSWNGCVQEALRLAPRVGDHRPGTSRDRLVHRHLPPPAPLRAGLPHPHRGRPHLGRPRIPTHHSDLTRQQRRGPRQWAVLDRPRPARRRHREPARPRGAGQARIAAPRPAGPVLARSCHAARHGTADDLRGHPRSSRWRDRPQNARGRRAVACRRLSS